jgi:hypothetical protein
MQKLVKLYIHRFIFRERYSLVNCGICRRRGNVGIYREIVSYRLQHTLFFK